MPITNQERSILRTLVDFIRDELDDAGDPVNSLRNLAALTDQRIEEYQTLINSERAAVYALIDVDPAAHAYWQQAQIDVYQRLFVAIPLADFRVIVISLDPRVRVLARTLPVWAALRWTLNSHQGGV